MIISDRYRFCFIHIPKCAGSAVRGMIGRYDESGGGFAKPEGEALEIGDVDYGHIPLEVLSRFFPLEYQKVKSYSSFCLVRDPYKRFASSVSQRAKMYKGRSLSSISKRELMCELDEAINYLSSAKGQAILARDYIHFQPQVSYIFNGSQKVVNNVYRVSDHDTMLSEIGRLIGHDIVLHEPSVKANRTLVYRSGIALYGYDITRRALAPSMRMFISDEVRARLKRGVRRRLMVNRDDRFGKILGSKEVQDFVSDFYRDDIDFYKSMA
jgi:hypothetical protein